VGCLVTESGHAILGLPTSSLQEPRRSLNSLDTTLNVSQNQDNYEEISGLFVNVAWSGHRVRVRAVHPPPVVNPSPSRLGATQNEPEQHLDFPFYRESSGWHSTLMLNNNSRNPLEATITLYSAKGSAHATPPVTVPTDHPIYLALADLAAAGGPDFRQGNIRITYQGPPDQLTGQVTVVSRDRRMSFEARMAMGMEDRDTKLEGIVWRPEPGAEAWVYLTNLSNHSLEVTTNLRGQRVRVGPRETRLLESGDLRAKGVGRSRVVLVRLEYDGQPGELAAGGAVIEPKTGYSGTVTFVNAAAQVSTQLAGAQFRFSPAHPESGFPAGIEFRAWLAIGNVGPAPTEARIAVDYTLETGPGHIELAPIAVSPGEVTEVDLAERLAGLGLGSGVETAGIEIDHAGAPGTLIASLVSLDQSGNHALETPLKDPQEGMYRSDPG